MENGEFNEIWKWLCFLQVFNAIFLRFSRRFRSSPVRGSDILSVRLRRIPSKSLIQRLNLQSRFSRFQITLIVLRERDVLQMILPMSKDQIKETKAERGDFYALQTGSEDLNSSRKASYVFSK
jgi:hypothetical protein